MRLVSTLARARLAMQMHASWLAFGIPCSLRRLQVCSLLLSSSRTAAFLPLLAEHPAGQHALRMFREYRRKLPGGGNGARVGRIHWPLRPVATVAGAGLAALGVLGLAAYGVYRVAKL